MRRNEMYFAPMRFLNHYELYTSLGFKGGSHLPDEGWEPMPLTMAHDKGKPLNFMVLCLPKDKVPGGSRIGKSRVFVQCNCGRPIPFGRMTQHFRGPKCRKDA